VSAFDSAKKPIATLCHGPWVLASAGLLQGRTLTSWPGIRDDLVNAGATWLDQEVVQDSNLLTSRSPQDIVPFVQAITKFFSDPALVEKASLHATASAPQRDEPPQVVLSAMKWLPRPSLRTALGLGALAAGILTVNKLRGTA
jgi:protease I